MILSFDTFKMRPAYALSVMLLWNTGFIVQHSETWSTYLLYMFQHTLAVQREIGLVRKQDDDVTQTDRCPQQLSRFNSVSAAINRVYDRSLLSVRTLRSSLGRARPNRKTTTSGRPPITWEERWRCMRVHGGVDSARLSYSCLRVHR